MTRPRIALLGRFTEHASALRYAGVVSSRALVEALWQAGGEPLTLLPVAGADWAERLRGVDGVLLAGGGDLDPRRYGADEVHPEVYDVDGLQDDADLELAAYVLDAGVPTLAVCRGLHVVNVLRGGSLVQHMDAHHRHRVHDVELAPEVARFGIAPGRTTASCYHHQCVDRLGDGLEVLGRAEDGTVEAVAIEAPGWAFGVQWHPEDYAAVDTSQLAIFAAFIDACRP